MANAFLVKKRIITIIIYDLCMEEKKKRGEEIELSIFPTQ